MKKYLIASLLLINSAYGFSVDKTYYIKKIEFNGLKDVPKIEILKNIKFNEGTLFSDDKVLNLYNEISKIKYLDSVTIRSEKYSDGIKVIIDMKEKENVKELLEKDKIIPATEIDGTDTSLTVIDIEISGNFNISAKELKKVTGIKYGDYFSKYKLERGRERLMATGLFREVKYETYRIGNDIVVSYIVLENPVIDDLVIEGNEKIHTNELKKAVKFESGKVLSLKRLREIGDGILTKYNEKGYVLAKIEDINVVDGNKLVIKLSEGKINNVKYTKMITKQRSGRRNPSDTVMKTKDYVIEREIEIKSNEVFDIKTYNETAENLLKKGYFKNVKYELKETEQGKDLVLVLEEERTASLQASLSYGSEIGFLGTLSLRDMNWLGKGQDVEFTFEKSDKDYTSFSLNFSDPWIRGTDRISWGWGIYKIQSENDDSILFYDTDIYGIKANIGKGLNKFVQLSLGGKAEYITEKPNGPELESIINSSTGSYKTLLESKRGKEEFGLFTLYPAITYDSRNSYLNPTKGAYGRFQVEVGYTTLKDAEIFTNATFDIRKYHIGFFKKNTFKYKALREMENVFAYRLNGGIMTSSTPESQRFWIGGGSSLRGYDGGYFQGTKKLLFTIENRTQINEVLGFVVFSDMGRAWDYDGIDPGYIRLNRDAKFAEDIAYTAGFGLRINTPIGPLRFDFGWPIGDKNNKEMKFYFSMGQTF